MELKIQMPERGTQMGGTCWRCTNALVRIPVCDRREEGVTDAAMVRKTLQLRCGDTPWKAL